MIIRGFVTPEFDKNNLLAHARTKEVLVRTWSLPFLTDDFTVLLYDGDDYLVEIKKVLSAAGQALSLDLVAPVLATPNGAPEDFERNIDRKCRIRLAPKALTANFEGRIQGLKQLILENFLKSLLFDEPGQHSMAVDSQRALLNQLSSQLTLQSIVAASFDESEDVFRNATRNIDFKLIQWGGKLIRPL